MDDLWQDLKYGARSLLKNPGFTVVAVIALALGIGANTAVFSVVYGALLQPLPYASPERLVRIFTIDPTSGRDRMGTSYGDFLDWQRQSEAFEDLATFSYWTFNLTGRAIPERIVGARASGNLFSLLGAPPLLGRVLTPEDDAVGVENVVLSYPLWQRVFGGDRAIVGKAITVNGRPHTVVGVMPPGFRYPEPPSWSASDQVELWGTLAGNLDESRIGRFLDTVGRLKPGLTIENARADMDVIVRQLENQYPDTNAGWRVRLVPLHDSVTGGVRPTLMILMGAVGLVLLVACANVANLLLARATARSREISIRAALGAGGSRLVRQLLTESLLLSLVGGVLGCVGAHWGVAALKALGPEGIPRLADIHVEGHVLAFALSLSVLTGLLFGLAPAFHSIRIHLHDALRQGGRTTGSDHRSLRSLLVVAEVALTLVLAVGAGLLIRTFVRVVEVDPGFRPDRLLTLNVFLTGQRYDTIVKQKAFVRSALERLEALPGVETASMVSAVPFGQTSNSLSFQIEGREAPQDKLPRADYRAVDPEYFRNMSIPLVRGRPLTDHDDENAPRVVLVNEAMVRRFWAGDDPIGQTIRWVFQGRDTGAHTVVGVVADVKSYGLDREERPAVYGPFAQRSFPWLRWKTFAVRTASPSSISAVELRQALLEIDPDLPVYGIVGMEELMADSLSSRRFIVLVLSSFAAVALVLASVGIYGVISYGMTRRTNEIGVRMALGARRHDILGMVIREGMAMTSLGIVVGVIGAVLLTRYLQSLLFGVEPTDPLTFLAVVVLFVAVAAGACFFPANRSMKIDPVRTLRHE